MGIFDIFRRKEKKDPSSSSGSSQPNSPQSQSIRESDAAIQNLIDNKDKYQNNQVAGDNRNEYQMRMNALRTGRTFDPSQFAFTDRKGNQINPGSDNKTIGNAGGAEAYKDRFPISNFAMEGLPKIIGSLASAGTPFGLVAPIARYIYNSGPGQDVRGMVGDTVGAGITNAGNVAENVIKSLQEKYNEFTMAQGNQPNPAFIPNKLTDQELREDYPFSFNDSIVQEAMGGAGVEDVSETDVEPDTVLETLVNSPQYKSLDEIQEIANNTPAFETTEEVISPLSDSFVTRNYGKENPDIFVNEDADMDAMPYGYPGLNLPRTGTYPDNPLAGMEGYPKVQPGINYSGSLDQGGKYNFTDIYDSTYNNPNYDYGTVFSDRISDGPPALGQEIRTFPQFQASGGYMSGFPNQNPAESLTASDNIDDRIMKNLQFEKMAPGMMGYNQGGEAKGIYEKLKSFNDHG